MKVFTVAPFAFLQTWHPDSHFFSRDMGLTCYALRELGVESQVIALHGPTTKEHSDIIRTNSENLCDSEWWKAYQLDGVVLGAGAAPIHTPIARAIKESGAKLIVRCDCGAAYSQWQQSLWRSLYINHLGPCYAGKSIFYSWLYSLAKTPWHYCPSVYEKRVYEHMSHADLILLETPEGVRLTKERLCRFGRADIAARIQYVPHPVSGSMEYNTSIQKEKRIIAVGRWEDYSKNAPLLIKSLAIILDRYPDYEAHVFGSGDDRLHQLKNGIFKTNVKNRIFVHGKIPNAQLGKEYLRSRIFFAPSRSESFNIAGAEALSGGCSFVGSGHIFSFRNFVSKNSGMLARTYTAKRMAEALSIEIIAWGEGLRNPERSSFLWRQEVAASTIAKQIASVCKGGNGE